MEPSRLSRWAPCRRSTSSNFYLYSSTWRFPVKLSHIRTLLPLVSASRICCSSPASPTAAIPRSGAGECIISRYPCTTKVRPNNRHQDWRGNKQSEPRYRICPYWKLAVDLSYRPDSAVIQNQHPRQAHSAHGAAYQVQGSVASLHPTPPMMRSIRKGSITIPGCRDVSVLSGSLRSGSPPRLGL
jgi:hypothetical protein